MSEQSTQEATQGSPVPLVAPGTLGASSKTSVEKSAETPTDRQAAILKLIRTHHKTLVSIVPVIVLILIFLLVVFPAFRNIGPRARELSPSSIALVIALSLLIMDPLSNRIVRKSWERQDFFRGIQFTLSACFSAVVYAFELAGPSSPKQGPPEPALVSSLTQIQFALGFAIVCFLALLAIFPLHQDYERDNLKPVQQYCFLGIGTNFIGIAALVIFVLIIKGA